MEKKEMKQKKLIKKCKKEENKITRSRTCRKECIVRKKKKRR
jgi:hypothetical protein